MNKQDIGDLVKKLRLEQGLTQQTLAVLSGLTRRQQIIEIEEARSNYSIDTLIKVLGALDIELNTTEIKYFNFKNVSSNVQ